MMAAPGTGALAQLPLNADALREFLPHLCFALSVLFFTAFFVFRLRKRGARNASAPTARDQLERYRARDAVRGDLEGLMVEIEDLARRLGAQLDAKARTLETLLDRADRAIVRLGGDAPGPRDTVELTGRADPRTGAAADATPAPPPGRADQSKHAAAADPPPDPGTTPAPDTPDPPADPLVSRVYALADAGGAPPAIAAELSAPIGQVELILALRRAGG